MPIYTAHVDFRLDTFPPVSELKAKFVGPLESMLETPLSSAWTSCSDHVRTMAFTSTDDVMVILRVYDNAEEKVLLTMLLEAIDPFEKLFHLDPDDDLEYVLRDRFENCFNNVDGTHFYPVLKRCSEDSPYMRTSDDRLLEYGFTKVCFSKRSPFQLVQIVDTIDFGKVLVLDNLVNLGESDTEAYTHNLMCLPQGFGPKYKDSKVLILGGGDGALLKELLELPDPPEFVTMIEIDEVVMDSVSEHMPSVCGPYLKSGNRNGPRHEIIVGDAIAFMQKELDEGKQYDFIFGDLTDTPVSTSPRDEDLYKFLKTIVEMGIKLLKPETGYYLTHCIGKCATEAFPEYESVLRQLYNGKCTFTTSECFVPSFMETWVYYQIQRHE